MLTTHRLDSFRQGTYLVRVHDGALAAEDYQRALTERSSYAELLASQVLWQNMKTPQAGLRVFDIDAHAAEGFFHFLKAANIDRNLVARRAGHHVDGGVEANLLEAVAEP